MAKSKAYKKPPRRYRVYDHVETTVDSVLSASGAAGGLWLPKGSWGLVAVPQRSYKNLVVARFRRQIWVLPASHLRLVSPSRFPVVSDDPRESHKSR